MAYQRGMDSINGPTNQNIKAISNKDTGMGMEFGKTLKESNNIRVITYLIENMDTAYTIGATEQYIREII